LLYSYKKRMRMYVGIISSEAWGLRWEKKALLVRIDCDKEK